MFYRFKRLITLVLGPTASQDQLYVEIERSLGATVVRQSELAIVILLTHSSARLIAKIPMESTFVSATNELVAMHA